MIQLKAITRKELFRSYLMTALFLPEQSSTMHCLSDLWVFRSILRIFCFRLVKCGIVNLVSYSCLGRVFFWTIDLIFRCCFQSCNSFASRLCNVNFWCLCFPRSANNLSFCFQYNLHFGIIFYAANDVVRNIQHFPFSIACPNPSNTNKQILRF